MSTLQDRLAAYPADALRGMRCGIEKEGLQPLPSPGLALTPPPLALGSALTHPLITTDYSESQLELITGAHRGVQQCLDELTEVHQFVHPTLKDSGEVLWASSMPCGLPTDETIPLARYGSSNIGRAKSVYRMGLGDRYGRRMQTISGIHYNWSLPGVDSGQYFALIRNFRRHAFVLLYLFGASPALCPCYVQGREHRLQQMAGGNALYLPHATSLRMGRLGYQSEAQARLAVSYNGLQGYADSLHEALTQPYPAYERVGLRKPGGDYNQLGTSLLQIENEFYGSIRPKRSVRTGERPLHALRERGVEYVEVRLMDLDPFVPVGITAATMRLLDVFLLHCLLSDSPPDTSEEIAELQHNQQLAPPPAPHPTLPLHPHPTTPAPPRAPARRGAATAGRLRAAGRSARSQPRQRRLRRGAARRPRADDGARQHPVGPRARCHRTAARVQLRGLCPPAVDRRARPAAGPAVERRAAGALSGAGRRVGGRAKSHRGRRHAAVRGLARPVHGGGRTGLMATASGRLRLPSPSTPADDATTAGRGPGAFRAPWKTDRAASQVRKRPVPLNTPRSTKREPT